ncbi:MAG: hypothetical protein AMS25_03770 [Gemmatimonas sp. SM23_52]|nr:MAG: hypothetical protein AMS25_03770 [Gemmatimonas sp. SM23_52]
MHTLRVVSALLILAPPSAASGQSIASLLGPRSFDWHAWETHSEATKRDVLERLGICVDLPGMVEDHHFLDFSGDGIVDLIYSGEDVACDYPGTGEKRTALFLARDGELSEIFINNGEIVDMWREAPWQPVSFLVRWEMCCGDVFIHYEYFYPVSRRGSLSYEGYSQITSVVDMPLPVVLYEAPKPFVVEQGPCSLRVTPGVDDDFRWPYSRPHDPTGNLLARYRTGAIGIALGESPGPNGRTWWFVLMDASSRPLGIRGFQGGWESAPPGRGYLGWMDSDALGEVVRAPRSLDTYRYWRRR